MKHLEKFRALGLSPASLSAVDRKGFTQPSPIQEKVIPLLLSGRSDVVGQAQTGTGKTAAFSLPILEGIQSRSRDVQALVLTPTRELALQVAAEMTSLRGDPTVKVTSIYGGQSLQKQVEDLRRGVHVVVGTPGRVLDHLERRTLNLQSLRYCILDEADEMLNMGFLEDVKKILSHTNRDKRNLMFSATMPEAILKVAKKHMGDYQLVQMGEATLTVPLTDQSFIEVEDAEKFPTLCQLIDGATTFYGLVFCRTKHEARKTAKRLQAGGYPADSLHGNLSQSQRERVMNAFRRRQVRILVATDVASRGIDVSDLTHVVNYGLPQDPESYVHRIGRTGRAGKEGKAIALIGPKDRRKLAEIEKLTRVRIRAQEDAASMKVPFRDNRPVRAVKTVKEAEKPMGFTNRPYHGKKKARRDVASTLAFYYR